jgi:hypothetical protein
VLSRTLPPTKDDLYRGMKSDAYVVDLRSGSCHRVARQAFDAAWINAPDRSAIDEARDCIGRGESDTSNQLTPAERTR